MVLQIPLKQFEKYFTAQRFIRFTSAARVAKDQKSKAPDNRKLAFFIEAVSYTHLFGYSRVSVPAQVLENSGRELNETYKEKLLRQKASI